MVGTARLSEAVARHRRQSARREVIDSADRRSGSAVAPQGSRTDGGRAVNAHHQEEEAMKALTPWTEGLRRDMERFFERLGDWESPELRPMADWTPKLDFSEDRDAF